MLVFGPFRAIPKDEDFVVFNLSSQTQVVPRLPGLFAIPNQPMFNSGDGEIEKSFDFWYYNYVLNDPTACDSLMAVLSNLYDGKRVYICIADYSSDNSVSMLNESFMKIIQSRYDIKYSIINNPEDFLYIPKDGCDFASVEGIRNFDEDRKRFIQLAAEKSIMFGNVPNYDYSY